MNSYLRLFNVISNEDAQGLVDYALILSLVAIMVLGAIFLFGQSVLGLYESIWGQVTKV